MVYVCVCVHVCVRKRTFHVCVFQEKRITRITLVYQVDVCVDGCVRKRTKGKGPATPDAAPDAAPDAPWWPSLSPVNSASRGGLCCVGPSLRGWHSLRASSSLLLIA